MHNLAKYLSLTALILLLCIANSSEVGSQGAALDWDEPTNLSRSGLTTAPKVVIDQSGVVHVFWQDNAVNSFMYIQRRPDGGSSPTPIDVPFGTRENYPDLSADVPIPLFDPVLLADNRGLLHAFWLDERGRLYYSRVLADQIGQYEQWSPRVQLAATAAGFSAAADNAGRLHLGYLRDISDEDFPAGVYYRQLISQEEDWSNAQLIYSSPYYQMLSSEQANINLGVSEDAGSELILLTWDNPAEELVFLSRSVNGGANWNELTVVDRRQEDDGFNSVGPSNITVTASGDDILLIWQAGHGLESCSQYYQWSEDGGDSWSGPGLMLDQFSECSTQNEFAAKTSELTLLLTFHQNQPYLTAWDGQRWGEPQPQAIADFIHPDTNRRIDIGCHQLALLNQERLLLVGCGLEPISQTADIWLSTKAVGGREEWYPAPAAWIFPVEVASDIPAYSSPQMVADNAGRVHAFWSQPGDDTAKRWAVHYARWQEDQWTPAVLLLPSAQADQLQPQVAVGFDDRLMMAWVNGSGDAYFSQASVDRAFISADWSTPIQIPSPESIVTAPAIGIDPNGIIYIAYTIPANEERGIYLVQSDDEGRSWLPPYKVFDGTEAGWEIVGPATVAVTDKGILHIQWTKDLLDVDSGRIRSSGLFYANSIDQGRSFSEPMLVDETTVVWNQLTSSNEIAHRFWQERLDSSSSAYHQYSVDNGHSWSSPIRVANSSSPLGVTVDSSGQLHLLEVNADQLVYQVWNGSSWDREEGLEFTPVTEDTSQPTDLRAAVVQDQLLTTLIAHEQTERGADLSIVQLSSSWRALAVPESPLIIAAVPTIPPSTGEATAEPTTVTPEAATKTTPVSTPPLTATTPSISEQETNSPIFGIENNYIQWAIIAVPVALFLIVVVFLVLRSVRSPK